MALELFTKSGASGSPTAAQLDKAEMTTFKWIQQWNPLYKRVMEEAAEAEAKMGEDSSRVWKCDNCTFEDNEWADETCGMCSAPKPDTKAGKSGTSGSESGDGEGTKWGCSVCTFLNESKDLKCNMCMSPRKIVADVDYVLPMGGLLSAKVGLGLGGGRSDGAGGAGGGGNNMLRQASVEETNADAVLEYLDLDQGSDATQGVGGGGELVIDDLNSEAARNFVNANSRALGGSSVHQMKRMGSGGLASEVTLGRSRSRSASSGYDASGNAAPREFKKAAELFGITELQPLQTLPWPDQMVFLPTAQATALVVDAPRDGKLVVRDCTDLPFLKEVNAAAVMVPTEIFGEKIAEGGGPPVIKRQVMSLQKTLSSRYARDMVLRSMFGGIVQSKPNEGGGEVATDDGSAGAQIGALSEDLEDLSKLLKLVAANEGVLEGKKSATMEELVRAIQRTIERRDKNQGGASSNHDRSGGLADLLINECVDHISGATIPANDEIEVRESLHPCFPGSNYEGDPISFARAAAMRIKFDTVICDLGKGGSGKAATLEFFEADGTTLIKRFQAGPGGTRWDSFTTTATVLRWRLKINPGANKDLHGFRLVARPLRGLGIWLNEAQVLHQHSLEWACWLLDLMLESSSPSLNRRVRDPRIIDALENYLMKPSSPYKNRVITLLSRLLSDANFFCSEIAIHGPLDDTGAAGPTSGRGGASKSDAGLANSTWMPNPDLALLRGLGASVLVRANSLTENYIPKRMKPVLELTCVAEIICRATRSPEWMYGDALVRDTPVSVPLTPRLLSCPPCKDWKSVSKLDALMDIIVITQCIVADPPLRLPDQLSTEVFRRIQATGHTLTSAERKRVEKAIRENAKLRAGQDRALMLWLEKKCRFMGTSLLALDCADKRLYLSDQDKQDHIVLQHIGPMTIRFRVALIQLLNRRMSIVMKWLDFDRTQDKYSLAFRLQKLAHLVFTSVKSDVFQRAIEKTWGKGLGKGREIKINLSKNKAFASADAFAKAPNQPPGRSQCLFMQLYHSKIGRMKPEALRSKLHHNPRGWCHKTLWETHFTDGEGMDYGGLYRDCMAGVAKCMWMDEFPLFKRVPNGLAKHGGNQDAFMPNSDCKSQRDLFVFAGQILGISIRTKGKFEVRFPEIFYKLLAGSPLSLEDLATIDKTAYHDEPLSNSWSSTTTKRMMSEEGFKAAGGEFEFLCLWEEGVVVCLCVCWFLGCFFSYMSLTLYFFVSWASK